MHQASDIQKQVFAQQHPTFEQLIKVHGPPAGMVEPQTSALKDRLLELHFSSPLKPNETFELKVPSTLPIRQLKRLIQRKKVFDVPASKQVLTCHCQGDVVFVANDDMKELAFYSIASGDKIVVTAK
eukprot:m.120330 g.120330  ORF g.120330 m.120330 type:complete len:127 (+) comp23228_c1_seq5:342-722(+)